MSASLQDFRLLARLLVASVLVQVCHAVPPVVTNVRASQSFLSQQVEIHYDLQDADSATVRVALEVFYEISPGVTVPVPATSLSGFGFGDSVTPGRDRYILWNAPADWPGQQSNSVRFRVIVNDDPIPTGMVQIPAGNFQMGDASNPFDGSTDERPRHPVNVSAFYMDRFEVTKALWDEVRAWGSGNGRGYDDLPVGGGKGPAHPVQTVSWYAMVKWCNARSQKEGLTPCYYTNDAQTVIYKTTNVNVTNAQVKWGASGYRLPTEAEWEKAARGGLSGKRFPWGDTINHSFANYYNNNYSYESPQNQGYHPTYAVNGFPYTSAVGSFAPNGYGLYDVAGNVWEWCWDWYGSSYYSTSPSADPQGPPPGSDRVVRGGSWINIAYYCRAAYRFNGGPGFTYTDIGFRTVRR